MFCAWMPRRRNSPRRWAICRLRIFSTQGMPDPHTRSASFVESGALLLRAGDLELGASRRQPPSGTSGTWAHPWPQFPRGVGLAFLTLSRSPLILRISSIFSTVPFSRVAAVDQALERRLRAGHGLLGRSVADIDDIGLDVDEGALSTCSCRSSSAWLPRAYSSALNVGAGVEPDEGWTGVRYPTGVQLRGPRR